MRRLSWLVLVAASAWAASAARAAVFVVDGLTPGGAPWVAPYDPASPRMLDKLHDFMNFTDEGHGFYEDSRYLPLCDFKARSEGDRRAFGALAARLPASFEKRLMRLRLEGIAFMNPRSQRKGREWIVRELRSAYRKAAPEAARTARARLQELARAIRTTQMGPAQIMEEAAQLRPFILFDPELQQDLAALQRAAQARQLSEASDRELAAMGVAPGQTVVEAGPGPISFIYPVRSTPRPKTEWYEELVGRAVHGALVTLQLQRMSKRPGSRPGLEDVLAQYRRIFDRLNVRGRFKPAKGKKASDYRLQGERYLRSYWESRKG